MYKRQVDGKPIDEASYENIYTLPEPTTAELFVDKSFVTDEGEAFDFGDNIFSFTVEPQNNAPEPEKLSIFTKLSDAAEEKDMSFGKIQFTEDPGITAGSSKDYVYIIRETEGDNPSVTYDDTVIKATVTVTKDADNKLSASVVYTVGDKPIDEASYENIYTLPEPTTAELLVDKSFVTAEGEAFNFGENIFSFTVDPQDGAPAPEKLSISTKLSDAAEEKDMSCLLYTSGVYQHHGKDSGTSDTQKSSGNYNQSDFRFQSVRGQYSRYKSEL